MSPPPPLLGALDASALLWIAGWSAMVSVYRAASSVMAGQKRPLWHLAVEVLLGGLPGGVLAGVLAVESGWKTPGKLALSAMFGATIGPYVAGWMLIAAPQVLPQLVKKFTGGLTVTFTPPPGGPDAGEDPPK